MAAHQAPPSLGFSRQEHWSGLPFPSPVHGSEKGKWSRLVVSHPQQPNKTEFILNRFFIFLHFTLFLSESLSIILSTQMLSTFWKKWDTCDAMLLFDIIFFSMLLQMEFYIIIAYRIRGISGCFPQMEWGSDWPPCNFLLWIWVLRTSKISMVLFTFANGLFFLYRRGFCVEDKRHSLWYILLIPMLIIPLCLLCVIFLLGTSTLSCDWCQGITAASVWEHFNY